MLVLPCPKLDLSWIRARIAQSVERVLGKDEVTGSSPVVGSILKNDDEK